MTQPTPPSATDDREVATICPRYHRAVELIGKRWTGAIVRAMLSGSSRFGEIGAAVPDLSDRMLSERLKELEAAAVVERDVEPDSPAKIEYRLTKKGRDLEGAVGAIERWAERWVEVPADAAADDG